ncbi:hypothetical protein ACFL20_08010 [Spirochaetota bacterium]
MGDKEDKIEYSPEELEEIDRIVGVATSEPDDSPVDSGSLQKEQVDPEPVDDVLGGLLPDDDIEAPIDIDLSSEEPGDDMEMAPLEGGETVSDLPEFEPIADVSEIEDMEIDDFTSSEDVSEVKQEGFDEIQSDDIEDITGLIEEVDVEEISDIDEISPIDETTSVDEITPVDDLTSLDEISSVGDMTSDIDGPPDDDFTGDLDDLGLGLDEDVGDIQEKGFDEGAPSEVVSTSLDELEALTVDEPTSVDIQDISDDQFVGEDITTSEIGEMPPVDDIGEVSDFDMDDLGDFSDEPTVKTASDEPQGVSLDKGIDVDIPDLSDISLEDAGDLVEADDTDIPDLDISDISEEPVEQDVPDVSMEDDTFDEPADVETTLPTDELIEDFDDIDVGDVGIDDFEEPMDTGDVGEPMSIEPIDEGEIVPDVAPPIDEKTDNDAVELTDGELKKFRKAIILFNPAIKSVIHNVVINDQLPPKETKKLINMIITGKPEDNIHRFLEKSLKTKIVLQEGEVAGAGRRVISARPEYTIQGRERQKRIFKIARIFGIAAVATIVVVILGYQFLYKPIMAKRKIHEGVETIRRAGDYIQKPKDYAQAERIFKEVNDSYIENYLYGYNEYGKAYFSRKEYSRSLKKLNKAYTIDNKEFKSTNSNIETLNNLGYFYSKVPEKFYKAVKSNIDAYYYPGIKEKKGLRPQLDVAIEFYRRVLVLDKKNIKALSGIGHAYFYQGEFVKAKKYFEDIIRINKDAIIGYEGLLNLYIERDAFPQVASTHTEVRERGMLTDISSPLLAKLAGYYLDKRKTDKVNVRIDYGVRSKRLKDMADNTYPAVRSVLKALNTKDKNYPPLHLQYARLSHAEKNYKLMKKYLLTALEGGHGMKSHPNYYGALHLLGEYYYYTREPVNAYKYLNKAINSYGNQPDFTREDYYGETEKLGRTYELLGNIFYYFFDKVKSRYGDLEDEKVDDKMTRISNYNIAREKYEMALKEKHSTPGLHYNLGRIYYLNKLYRKSLNQWLHLYEDFVQHPELMVALGNAFYHMGNYEASKGEYLKLISYFEHKVSGLGKPNPGEPNHIAMFQSLATAYNNIGAVYQIQKNESKSSLSYWKAIDYSKRLNVENHYSRVNLARSFNRKKAAPPILDEDIPFSIEYYRDDLRK